MSSNSPFNIPGLGNLEKSSVRESVLFNQNNMNSMGSEGHDGENSSGGGASGPKTSDSQVQHTPSFDFCQKPPGTSSFFAPPLLPPPTGSQTKSAGPSFGVTAGAMDFSAARQFPVMGFNRFTAKAGEEKFNHVGSSGASGSGKGSAPVFGEGTSPAFPQASVVRPSTSDRRMSLEPGEIHEDSSAMFRSAKSSETSTDTESHVISPAGKLTWRVHARNDSASPQHVLPFNSGLGQQGVRDDRLSVSTVVAPHVARTGYQGSGGGDHADTFPTTSAASGQDVPMDMDSHNPTTPADSKFGSFDIHSITPDAAIFCFGVLATQANFAPRFEYSYGGGGLWGVKLTFWGHTIIKQELSESKVAAKAAICRQALEVLKPQFESWIMPDPPANCSTSTSWNWPHVLQKHCFQAGIDDPVYTKYLTGNGYRFEVEVSGSSYFGMLKHYRSEVEAKNASAHLGLFSTLVNNTEDTTIFPGASFARSGFANNWDEFESSMPIRRTPGVSGVQNLAAPSGLDSTNHVSNQQNLLRHGANNKSGSAGLAGRSLYKARKAKSRRATLESPALPAPVPAGYSNAPSASNGSRKSKKARKRSRGNSTSSGNPNPYQPSSAPNKESHPWLAKFKASAERRWHVRVRDLEWQTRGCGCHKERVAVICGLLALQDPEYNLDIYNRGFGAPEHYAAAFFPNDPFLARAGAIGQVRYTHDDRCQAGEECAREVAKYLINMVEQDVLDGGTGEHVHIKTEPDMQM